MGTERRYGVTCCTGLALVYLDVGSNGTIKVRPEGPQHMTIAVNPVVDGKLAFPPDQLHAMTTGAATERQVTEIDWQTHRSWIVRCGEGSCTQQVEVSSRSFPRLAHVLEQGTWPEVDGVRVVQLRVLNRAMTPKDG